MKIKDKYDMLFIRACKHSRKRVESVYKRFYMKDEKYLPNLMCLLAEICDKYFEVNLVRFLSELSPNSVRRLFYKDEPYWSHAVQLLINQIKFTDGDYLKKIGYKVPRMFRSK